ncbi:cohesin domain-containing protein [Natronoglomus mannanivorans]|uniref:Cohesin domain-containing protein n=1 Tax=Natronoglomus mannanivorans TaxID=2979990 RepID=A0AAP2YY53_9EURY|nr:cohesin domain-containing protein [Halobacteria archaeon AArc-xg1-1]
MSGDSSQASGVWRSKSDRDGSIVTSVIVCLAVGLLLTGAIAPAASAGDTVALFSFDPDEIEADPGDTVTVDVVLSAHEGYGGAGVNEISFGVEYDPDVLTVSDIERAHWLEGETAEAKAESDETTIDVTTDIDDESGLASITQVRESESDGDDDAGSAGTGPVATVTFEVSEDAQPTTAELTIVNSEVELTSDYQQGTMVRDGEILVDGGGDSETEAETDDDPDGITLADDGSGTNDGNSSSETDEGNDDSDDDEDEDEAIPGFGPLVAIGALVTAVVVRRYS